MNETGGKRIREQYADTSDFTDQFFAVIALLGYRFIPCIRDLLQHDSELGRCATREVAGGVGRREGVA
jgi:TnpA family transposase